MSHCITCGKEMHPVDAMEWDDCYHCRNRFGARRNPTLDDPPKPKTKKSRQADERDEPEVEDDR